MTLLQTTMGKSILLENFQQEHLQEKLSWFSEPTKWLLSGGKLQIYPNALTDFWQKTHYGFQVDNGHFLYASVKGDFVMETQVQCKFVHQYDQAGLMVRVSDQCWMKTSLEYEPDEANRLGVVVTSHGYSDWSTQNVADDFVRFSLRVSRDGSDYTIEYLDQGSHEWIQLRLFHLPDQPIIDVGLYACSPKGAGFFAEFEHLKITNSSN